MLSCLLSITLNTAHDIFHVCFYTSVIILGPKFNCFIYLNKDTKLVKAGNQNPFLVRPLTSLNQVYNQTNHVNSKFACFLIPLMCGCEWGQVTGSCGQQNPRLVPVSERNSGRCWLRTRPQVHSDLIVSFKRSS